jgi:predicted nucleic acid-binding protein
LAADRVALDSSILIDHERGVRHATDYVLGLMRAGSACVHPVAVAELLFGAQNRVHLQALHGMLRPLPVVAIKNSDFVLANQMLDQLVLATKIGWPDCLIAATCLRLNAPLATVNNRHFRWIKKLKVVRPY